MTNFRNRARLPFLIKQPQFPETRNEYRRADGSSVIQSVVIRKTYVGDTDYLSERLHQRLTIALSHDTIIIETLNYFGNIVKSADYQINWVNFLNYNVARALFQVEVTPFDATNSNCQTCEDATQVVAEDDAFYADLNENTDYTLNVIANDEICCFPAAYSITSYNADYLSVCTIDSSGVLHVHTKTGLVSANGLLLATYRVTCPNGGYDEADVTGNINGTIPGCLAPKGLSVVEAITDPQTEANVHWAAPSIAPDHYHWYLFNEVTSVIDQSGDQTGTATLLLTGLTPGNLYTFFIRSQCDGSDSDATASNYVSYEFSTATGETTCGQYKVALNDPGLVHGGSIQVQYYNCSGTLITTNLIDYTSKTIHALQTSPGVPTFIQGQGNPYFSVTYLGLL